MSGHPSILEFWAKDKILGVPASVWVLGAVTLVCIVLLHFTSYGRGIYAIGNNPRASFISGVPTTAIQIATYALCSFFAAITGLLILGRTGYSSKTAGDSYMLMSIAALVVGGTMIQGGLILALLIAYAYTDE